MLKPIDWLKYGIAGICVGLISLFIASALQLNLTIVVIVVAGLAAFIAGVLPTQRQGETEGPLAKV